MLLGQFIEAMVFGYGNLYMQPPRATKKGRSQGLTSQFPAERVSGRASLLPRTRDLALAL